MLPPVDTISGAAVRLLDPGDELGRRRGRRDGARRARAVPGAGLGGAVGATASRRSSRRPDCAGCTSSPTTTPTTPARPRPMRWPSASAATGLRSRCRSRPSRRDWLDVLNRGRSAMSFKFARIPAKAAGLPLTATQLRVLIAICLHADRDGFAHPSLARIGKIAHVQTANVAHSLSALVRHGLIRRDRTARGDGWANTQYQVIYEPAEVLSEEPLQVLSEKTLEVVSEETLPAGNGQCLREQYHTVSTDSTGTVWASSQPIEKVVRKSPRTNHLTDLPTEQSHTREQQVSIEIETINGAPPRITNTSCEIEPTPEAMRCQWPLDIGCARITLPGKALCAVHE